MPAKKVKKATGIMKKNIRFAGCHDTMKEVFGKKPIARPDVMRIVSAYIRENELVEN